MASNVDIYKTFLEYRGVPYRLGAEAKGDELDPSALDCSEGIELSCRRNGVFIPDGAQNQYEWCRRNGTLISVAEARRIVGAIAFRINFHGGDHVVLSDGRGGTMECKGRAYGCNTFSYDGRFNFAARIPNVDYSGMPTPGTPPPYVPPKSEEDDDMAAPKPYFIQCVAMHPGVFLAFANTKSGVKSEQALQELSFVHKLNGWDTSVHQVSADYFNSLATLSS